MNSTTLRAALPVVAILAGACAAAPGARDAGGTARAAGGTGTGWEQLVAGGGGDASPGGRTPGGADQEDDKAELAKKLANPIASLISVPIQSNWDYEIGPDHVRNYVAKVQPVIPFSLGEDWNLITRTIVPVVWTESPVDEDDTTWGLGDTLQSFFFSPKKPTSGGWVWGAGPAFQWPTSTDDDLGNGKVGAGPTAVVLKQESGWTYGALANHVWSFAGQGNTPDVNATFVQPFLSYTTASHTTFTLNSESTYDWETREWTIPLNPSVSQLMKVAGVLVQFQVGWRYYAHSPAGGPDWGLRFGVTLLFR